MELTDQSLMAMGGWQAFREAKAMRDAGRVSDATFDYPVLKGTVMEAGKPRPAGLRFLGGSDVENLCLCRDSRVRGIICPHSMAVGLQIVRPFQAPPPRAETPSVPRGPSAPRAPSGAIPQVSLSLEGSLRHLEAEIRFQYDPPEVSNADAEAAVFARLLELGFREVRGKPTLQGEEAILRFCASDLARLREQWHVTTGERFAHITKDFVRIEPRFALSDPGDGWLDFQVHYSAGNDALISPADLQKLLAGGGTHIRLRDGRTALADTSQIADLEEVLRDCDPRQERGCYRIAARHRGYLESSLSDWGQPPGLTRASPAPEALGSLRHQLRPYQVEGALWLLERQAGLLADEMGLGKTVQALALVEALPDPCLVVCPSSLVWNWLQEAGRFVPGLSAHALDGPRRRIADVSKHHLLVTSYALLRRDIELYRDFEFSAVILDEAQHIKNPDSQNAKAACALRAQRRYILTGTPIENSLRDLWSLFDFLLPGYLGSRKDFQDRYETPLLNGERGSLWQRLTRRTGPHTLRRRKAEILPDLPAKLEQVIEIELTNQQKSVYSQLQRAAREQVDALKKTSGGAARMKALTALLRLRQACCDLRLLGANAQPGHSSKLSALLELLGEAVDGGHRTLVFSQFTSMLDLIGEALDVNDLAYCRLDGSTRDRAEVVTRFQNNARIPVFLISLKAGGTGLNLTAADTVIHFDPWWNPAVEAQATDRAHRIGQNRLVTSIKLICRDTVEERVLRLQQSKHELLAGAIDSDAALQSLTTDDLASLVSGSSPGKW